MEERVWHRFYADGVPSHLEFEDVSLPGFLERAASQQGDATAIIFRNCQLTYRQLKEEVDRLATALAGLGVGKDARVALHMPNLPQTVIAYYASLSLGAQVVMTNPLYVEREIEHQWQDAGCRVAIVMDFLYASRLEQIRSRLPVEHYIIASIPDYLRFPLNLLAPLKLKRTDPPLVARVEAGEGIHHMKRLIKATSPAPPAVALAMDDVAVLQYTGGTTGVSKGAMLTHRNLSYNVQQVSAWFADIEHGREVMLAALPFFHVFGMTVAMNFPIHAAAAMVLMPNPRDLHEMVQNIARHRVTLFPGVPAMFNAINNAEDVGHLDVTSVKSCFSGGAPLPPDVMERFEKLTGSQIVEGYGLTETSPVTHSNPLGGQRKVGSIGIALPQTDCRIVDLEDGRTVLPPDQEGELVLKGPQVMKGYWQKLSETEAVLRDGWLHTGDIALMDADGYVYIAGRKKDLIIAGGYNIYPDEVDAVLMAHPAVQESATIGVPHERRGETVKSFVVLGADRTISAEELIHYSRGQLAAYKIPREIEFLDELPKSTVLKVLRRELRERELAKRQASPPVDEG